MRPDGGHRASPKPRRKGLHGWAAVLVLIGIAGFGGAIDQIGGASIRGGFNYALVLASLIAIMIVKRDEMFGVVVAPPLVYFAVSAVKLYIGSSGLHDRAKILDEASRWLVDGFPTIAGATAIVLVIAGFRMLSGHKKQA
jgi:hypothetical protein